MYTNTFWYKIMFSFTVLLSMLCSSVSAQKDLWWPTEWNNTSNEYYSRMSDTRKYESANFVIYWGDIVGTSPATYQDANLRFNPQSVADTLETSYRRYIDDLHFINNDPSVNFGKYKTIVVILGTLEIIGGVILS